MKHALLKTKSRLIMSLMIVIMSVVYTSCDDTETTDSTKFTIFYSGMTDIGPSMSGRISSPTYKGNTPSDFAITKVTLKGEAYSGDCFTIDPNDGFISINSTKDMQVGLYKLSISCISGWNYYEFKDIVEINFLKAVPDGITVEPNKLQVKYNDIIDETSEVELPTAQVKTDGDHVTITNYEIAKSDYSKYFDITKSGKISIIKGSAALLPGIYNISLKLTTGASSEDEGIFENALEINVTSAPFGLEYTPNEDMLEAENDKSGKTSFQSNAPALKGSLEGIEYSIKNITPTTDKIKIDPTTGVLSVDKDHGLQSGNNYVISIHVKNNFGEEDFNNAFTLQVVEYIEPISGFEYETSIDKYQYSKFTINPKEGLKGDNIQFSLINEPDALKGQIEFDAQTGTISVEKGNTIPQGNYSLTVRATNSKNAENPADATFTLNIIENPNYFTDIRYGNNIDVPEENNANQFRITEDNEANADATLKGFTFPSPQTGLKGDVSVAWSIKNGNKCDNLTIDSNTGKISFNQEATWPADNNGVKANTIGFCYVTATAGTDKDSQISQTTLVFIHYDLKANNGVHIHYNPFVFQADPKNGGNSTVPLVTVNGTTTTSNFALDYRRSFNYYPTEGTLVKGAPGTAGSFLNELWTTYYKAMDIKLSTGSRNPMSYYGSVYDMSHSKKLPNQSDRLSVALAYVVPNDLTIHISPNIWKNSNGEYANGIMVGEMTFLTNVTVDTTETGESLKNGKKIAPIIIWFDKKFIK